MKTVVESFNTNLNNLNILVLLTDVASIEMKASAVHCLYLIWLHVSFGQQFVGVLLSTSPRLVSLGDFFAIFHPVWCIHIWKAVSSLKDDNQVAVMFKKPVIDNANN